MRLSVVTSAADKYIRRSEDDKSAGRRTNIRHYALSGNVVIVVYSRTKLCAPVAKPAVYDIALLNLVLNNISFCFDFVFISV